MKTPGKVSNPAYDFVTPVNSFKSLSIGTRNVSPQSERDNNNCRKTDIYSSLKDTEGKSNSDTFETPLKRVGFAPLTPSENTFNIAEFVEETPVQANGTKSSNKTQLRFSVYSDETPTDANDKQTYPVVRSDVLPTIDEHSEIEGDASNIIRKASGFSIRKKQLFSGETMDTPHTVQNQTKFTVFVDDE